MFINFNQHVRFFDVCEDVDDDCGCPCMSRTDTRVKKKNRKNNLKWSKTQHQNEIISIDKETVGQILLENRNMTKVCAKLSPKRKSEANKC